MADEQTRNDWQEKITALERTLDELSERRTRLVITIETASNIDQSLLGDINRRVTELTRGQERKREDLARLRAHPPAPTGRDAALLDILGTVGRAELGRAPEELLRDLFDAFCLAIDYDARERLVACTVTVDERSLTSITAATVAIVPTTNPASGPPAGLGMRTARSAARSEHPQPHWSRSLRVSSTFRLPTTGLQQ